MAGTDKRRIVPISEAGSAEKRQRTGKRSVDKEESKRMGSVIRKYRTMAKLEQKQVAAVLGFTSTAVGNWELGLARPSLEIVGPLCDLLNMPLDELLGYNPITTLPAEDKTHLNRYHRLTRYNKETIDQLLDRLLFMQDTEERARLREIYTVITAWECSAAAGIGSPLPDYEEKQDVYVRADKIPCGATCIINVNGASMKPKYPDGCSVYVNTKAEVHNGDVGIFIVDGESYIKEMRPEGLHSYNPSYKTIEINESTSFHCFGKVLGIVDENDVPTGSEFTRVYSAFHDR
jgi:Predicted transcriptional regulator